MSWPVVTLGSVATLAREGIAPESISSGTLFVGLENITKGGEFEKVATVENGDITSTKFSFSAKHVLYGKLRPYLAKIALPEFEGVCSTDIIPILPGSGLDRRYLAHYLLTPRMVALASDRATGANLPRLSPKVLLEFPIPFPPLEVQRRIAAILDQAEELRSKRRAAIDLLDQLPQAIFLEMFGDPATNQMGWPMARIGDLLDSASYGTSGKAGTAGKWPVLRMGNITSAGHLDLTNLKYMDLTESEVSKYTVRKGDVLFNRTNSADLVGKTALYSYDEPVAFAGYLVRLRVNEKANPEFIAAYMNLGYTKKVLRGMAKSIVGMANINAKEVQSIAIPQPPMELQTMFAKQVESVRRAKEIHQIGLTECDALFNSLQSRFFGGSHD
jgi:type I restriction enzyme, S subunit